MDPTTAWDVVQAWPVEERLAFACRLWDQVVDGGWQPEACDELVAELDERLATHEADPTNVRTWDQVLERIRSRQ